MIKFKLLLALAVVIAGVVVYKTHPVWLIVAAIIFCAIVRIKLGSRGADRNGVYPMGHPRSSAPFQRVKRGKMPKYPNG